MPTTQVFPAAITMLTAVWASQASAQESGSIGAQRNDAAAAEPATPQTAAPESIVPIPDYTGEFWSRKYMSGDWDGNRTKLAERGLTFELDWTQTGQGVVSGGRRIDWDYGGSLDFVVNADLQRMGVVPGAIVKLRAESRYGESVNDDSGAILPVNTDMFFPLTGRVNEGIPITITEFTYLQHLSTTFGIVMGKLQTLDGDLPAPDPPRLSIA